MVESYLIERLSSGEAACDETLIEIDSEYSEDSERRNLLESLFKENHTDIIRILLIIPSFRRVFVESFERFYLLAYNQGQSEILASLIPADITEEEASLILEVLILKEHELAGELVKRGVVPTVTFFEKLCLSYANSPSQFKKALIRGFFRIPGFPWKKYMLFPATAGKPDVIARIKQTDSLACFILASWLLSDKEKIELAKEAEGPHFIYKMSEHMDMPKGWEVSIPRELKVHLIWRDTGI